MSSNSFSTSSEVYTMPLSKSSIAFSISLSKSSSLKSSYTSGFLLGMFTSDSRIIYEFDGFEIISLPLSIVSLCMTLSNT